MGKLVRAGRQREKHAREAYQSVRALEKLVRHVEDKGSRLVTELQGGREELRKKANIIKKLLLKIEKFSVRKKELRHEVGKEREIEAKAFQNTSRAVRRLKEAEHREAVERAIFAKRLANSVNVFRKIQRHSHHEREWQAEMQARERELKKQYKSHLLKYFQKRTVLSNQKNLAMRELGHERTFLVSDGEIGKYCQRTTGAGEENSKVRDIFAA